MQKAPQRAARKRGKHMYKVDLNSDLGESFGNYTIGMDEAVIAHISSANVACGYHAGDPLVMDKTVAACKAAGVAVGAHPGYPDLMGFGRRNIACAPKDAKAYVKYQLGALIAFTTAHGLKLQHCKPHGALYNQAAKDPALARAIAEAVYEVDPGIILLGLANSFLISEAEAVGLKTASEVFADRAYQADGSLVPRSKPGAVIHDKDEAIARTIRMVKEGTVVAITGETVPLKADSICVHGDNPSAVEFVKNIRARLTEEGVTIAPIREIV